MQLRSVESMIEPDSRQMASEQAGQTPEPQQENQDNSKLRDLTPSQVTPQVSLFDWPLPWLGLVGPSSRSGRIGFLNFMLEH